jgi:iron complex outermembrane receptor protein
VGFRIDNQPDAKDTLMVQGDGYKGSEGEIVSSVTSLALPQPQVANLRQDMGGWDVLTRWQHTASSTSQTTLQVYFDRTNRSDATYGESRNTFDIDFQHHIAWGHRQDLVWGLGFRATSDNIRGSFRVMFNPARETDLLYSSFVQDEIAVIPGRVYVTLDARLEHNRFTGFGLQPGISIAWLANQKTMFWASESRTVEAASRDQDARYNEEVRQNPGGLPILVSVLAAPQRNENVLSTEAGFRTQLLEGLSVDLAAFYIYNTHIQSTETGTPFVESDPAPVHLVSPLFTANLLHGEAHGAEFAVNWKPVSRWTLSPGFAYLQMHFHAAPTSTDTDSVNLVEGGAPREQAQLRSHLELTKHWSWDASAYFVGRLPALQVPAYTCLDTGLTWHPRSGLAISAVGQNLLQDHHLEFNGPSQLVASSLMKRSVYAKIVWHF